jgi:hypothetical protein
MPTRKEAKQAFEAMSKDPNIYQQMSEEGKRAAWNYGKDNGYYDRTRLTPQAQSEYDKYSSKFSQYEPKSTPSTIQDDLKIDKYARIQGVKAPLKENKPTTQPTIKTPMPKLSPTQLRVNAELQDEPLQIPKQPTKQLVVGKGVKKQVKPQAKITPKGLNQVDNPVIRNAGYAVGAVGNAIDSALQAPATIAVRGGEGTDKAISEGTNAFVGTLKGIGTGIKDVLTGQNTVRNTQLVEAVAPKTTAELKTKYPKAYNVASTLAEFVGVDDVIGLGIISDIAKVRKLNDLPTSTKALNELFSKVKANKPLTTAEKAIAKDNPELIKAVNPDYNVDEYYATIDYLDEVNRQSAAYIKAEAQFQAPKVKNFNTLTKTAADKSKEIPVYRGYAISDDASTRNLSKELSIMDVLGKTKQEVDLLPLNYYTESSDVAGKYANRDATIVQSFMNNNGKTREQAVNMFKTLYGHEPVMEGIVKPHTISPKKVLDLTELGEKATYNDTIKALLKAEGSEVPVWVKGNDNINSPKWENHNRIEKDIMQNIPVESSNDEFPIYMLMKSKGKDDVTGRNFVNWLKSKGYDAVKYAEDGTNHYAALDAPPTIQQQGKTLKPNKPIIEALGNRINKPYVETPTIAPKPLSNINTQPIINKSVKPIASNADEVAVGTKSDINMNTWGNKSKLALKRETMERNLYDMIPDKVEAKKVIDTYIEPIKKGEADNIRGLNAMRDEVKKFDIKSGSKESELIQKYGEGKISLDEVKKQTNDWQKVEEATKYFRNKYDELLTKANEVLTRNKYKEIPRRANYFPHQGEVDGIMKALGLESYDLPTDINGLTAGFKPGKNFFGNALERKGDKTVFDAVRGFDNYIEGVNRIIHHTDNIKRLRGLEKEIRTQFKDTTHLSNFVTELQEYTNLLAGKKSVLDRGMEELVGRGVYKAVDSVRKQLGANMVGANISSAMTNFIPLTQALATTDKESFVRGMVSTIANVIKNDGFIDQSDYLVRRFGSDKLVTSAWQKPGKALGWMFKAVDGFTSQVITRSKYLEGLKKGMPESEALKEANNFAAKVMADRSIGQVPTLFTSKTLAPLTQFQLEVNNQMSFLFKDIPQMADGNKAALASALGQVAIYSYLFNNLYEKATGRRPAFDVIGLVKNTIEDYNNGNIDNTEATKRLVENTANQLPFASFYTGGRIPMSNALPDFMSVLDGDKKLKDELIKPILNVALPTGGSQINKTVKGLGTVLKGGAYTDSNNLRYPVEKNTENLIKGAIFGPSSLPETIKYYDNKTAPLGEKQTKIIEKAKEQGRPIKPLYNKMLNDRKINSIEEKIAKIRKDNNLEWEEKQKQIKVLMEELKKFK